MKPKMNGLFFVFNAWNALIQSSFGLLNDSLDNHCCDRANHAFRMPFAFSFGSKAIKSNRTPVIWACNFSITIRIPIRWISNNEQCDTIQNGDSCIVLNNTRPVIVHCVLHLQFALPAIIMQIHSQFTIHNKLNVYTYIWKMEIEKPQTVGHLCNEQQPIWRQAEEEERNAKRAQKNVTNLPFRLACVGDNWNVFFAFHCCHALIVYL